MNIAELLFKRRAPNVEPKWLAEVLERLVWLMDDNGTEIVEALAEWVTGSDREKIDIALAFEEISLFDERTEMSEAFDKLCSQYPDLRTRCDEILAIWDTQFAGNQDGEQVVAPNRSLAPTLKSTSSVRGSEDF